MPKKKWWAFEPTNVYVFGTKKQCEVFVPDPTTKKGVTVICMDGRNNITFGKMYDEKDYKVINSSGKLKYIMLQMSESKVDDKEICYSGIMIKKYRKDIWQSTRNRLIKEGLGDYTYMENNGLKWVRDKNTIHEISQYMICYEKDKEP